MFCLEIYLELLEGIQNGPPSVSPRPAHAGLPLAVYLLSRGNHFHQLHTHRPTVSGTALPRQAQSTTGQYADLTGPHWRAPVCERDKEPCNCLLSRITRAIRGHGGNNYALGEEPRPPILSVCSIRRAVQLSVCDLGISKIINLTFWLGFFFQSIFKNCGFEILK